MHERNAASSPSTCAKASIIVMKKAISARNWIARAVRIARVAASRPKQIGLRFFLPKGREISFSFRFTLLRKRRQGTRCHVPCGKRRRRPESNRAS